MFRFIFRSTALLPVVFIVCPNGLNFLKEKMAAETACVSVASFRVRNQAARSSPCLRYGPPTAGRPDLRRLLIALLNCAALVYDHMIDRLCAPILRKIDLHTGAGSDCGSDALPFLVEDMSPTIKHVGTGTLMIHYESFARLIACRLASRNGDDRGLC